MYRFEQYTTAAHYSRYTGVYSTLISPTVQFNIPGVNRCLPLAVCEGVSELHGNLRTVLEVLELGRVPFFLAGDLKLINSLLGLSGAVLKIEDNKAQNYTSVTTEHILVLLQQSLKSVNPDFTVVNRKSAHA